MPIVHGYPETSQLTTWTTMKNQNGVTVVILKNSGKESGTQLSLGPGGMQIQMK